METWFDDDCRSPTLLKKDSGKGIFLQCKIFKNTLSYKTPQVAAFSNISTTQSGVQGTILQMKIKKNKTVSSRTAKKTKEKNDVNLKQHYLFGLTM